MFYVGMPMRNLTSHAVLLATLLATGAALAAAPALPPVVVELEAATTTAVVGDTVQLGIVLTPPEGWHLYWDGLNDTGFPPSFTWQLPPGCKVSRALWPPPARHVSAGDILDHVLEGRTVALVSLTVPAGTMVPGSLALRCHVEWLACKDICVPGKADLALDLPTAAAGSRPEASDAAAELAAARRALPRPLAAAGDAVRIARQDDVVAITVRGAAHLAFFPATGSARPVDLLHDGARDGDQLRLPLRGDDASLPLLGVLAITDRDGDVAYYQVDVAGSAVDRPSAKETP